MADIPASPNPEKQTGPPPNPAEGADVVWSFRGYKLRASEFNTAMVHLFRAEVQRANVWRQRLDTTTNWAVVTTGAVMSFAFTQSVSTHFVIALNLLLVTMFLTIEARRYRYYELWSYRVRLMETDFFAAMLVPPFHPSPDWAEALSENLLHPHFPISNLEAIGRRLRRNYLWIYAVIYSAWLAMLWLMPIPAISFREVIARAAIAQLGGSWVLLIALTFAASLILLSLFTLTMQGAAGEILPRYGDLMDSIAGGLEGGGTTSSNKRAWYRPSRKRAQLLTLIITDRAQAVSDRVLKDMKRGVTAIAGTGMFTGKAHTILMCALTVTEVPQIKALVASEDPQAFVIVTPAQEVFGVGFMPLKDE